MPSPRELMQTTLVGEFTTDRLGRLVSYNGVEIKAIYSIGENPDGGVKMPGGRMRKTQVAAGTIKVLKSDVPSWQYRDKVIIGTDEWRILGLIGDRNIYWKLRMETERRKVA